MFFGIGAHVPRRHQPGIVTKRFEPAAEMMCADAGLHTDQARGHVGKPCLHLATRPLLTQHDYAATIEPDDVERVLTDIDALASLSLVGQEHGRTIRLPAIRRPPLL